MILKNCTFFNENFEKEYGDIEIERGKIKHGRKERFPGFPGGNCNVK